MTEPQPPQPSIPLWTDSPEAVAAEAAFFSQPKPTREQMLAQVKRNEEARSRQAGADEPNT